MKSLTTLGVLTFFLLLNSCGTSQKTQTTFDPIVAKAKEVSLYTERVNWTEVNIKFIELTKGKKNTENLKEGLEYLINSLGDKHGTIRSSKDYSVVAYYTGDRNETRTFDTDFIKNVLNDVTAKFSYKLLDNDIGYLKVVGIGPDKVKESADAIRQGLLDLKAKGVQRWILDLRVNGGGDMNPMIAGLAPLIGDGFIGGSVDSKNELSHEYIIEKGQFFDTERLVCEMPNRPKIEKSEKVAILVSRYTISSGELVAVTFKGRENTRFIGEATGGLTTGNGWETITDELIMAISEGVYMDRNKNTYLENVGVDEEIEFQLYVGFDEDKQIKAAREWLLK